MPARHGLALALLLLIVCGCGDRSGPKAQSTVTVVLSGGTAGWITPCGCGANQSGGLSRRATHLNGLRSSGEVLYVDAGNAVAGASEYHRVKLRGILRGEVLMSVAAHNLGSAELALGAAVLRDLAGETAAPLVSSNTTDGGGNPLAEPIRFAVVGGRRFAILGVTDAPGNADLRVEPAEAAVKRLARQWRASYDLLVVLADVSEDRLEALAVAIPEADMLLSSRAHQPIAPRRRGPTTIAAVAGKGKFVAQVTIPAGKGDWAGSVAPIAAELPEDTAQMENLSRYLADLAGRQIAATDSGLAAAQMAGGELSFAGSQSCLTCHAGEHESWSKSKHATAWETLKTRQFHVDSYCQQCHTVGFGRKGGFESAASPPGLLGVGCESCHGPSAAHVARPTSRTPFAAADQCLTCHDTENSPKFDYASYWAKIAHGPRKVNGTTPSGGGGGQ